METKQDALNVEMTELGKARYRARKEKASKLSAESNTIPGRQLLNKCSEEMTKGIFAWLNKAKKSPGKHHRCLPFMEMLPEEQIAVIASKAIIDGLSTERMLTSLSISVGRAIEDEILLKNLEEQEPMFFRKMQQISFKKVGAGLKRRFVRDAAKAVELVTQRWPKSDALAVGVLLVEMMAERTGIIQILTKLNARGRRYCAVAPSKDISNWIKNCHEYHEGLTPFFLPSIERPLPWSNPWIGGYRQLDWKPRPLVKSRNKAYQTELAACDLSRIYHAVNLVQSTPWQVDQDVYDLIRNCWKESSKISGLPSALDEDVPAKPHDIETNVEGRRQWRKAAAKVYFHNESLESQRLQLLKTMFVAEKMKTNERIFFPQQLDFRGRGYPLPLFLHPQGTGIAKSMLRFARGKPITTESQLNALKLHCANKWGLDKKSRSERLNWIESNTDLIKCSGTDPYSNTQWIRADDPFSFYAACKELSNFWVKGFGYVSRLPVGMDATTQGLQIYSLLLRDPVAAAATNVLPGSSPADPYQAVANRVIDQLLSSDSEYARPLLSLGIDRSTTKRQTMTLPYGLTQHSCIGYTREWLEEKLRTNPNPFGLEVYKPAAFLGRLIWNSMEDVVGSATRGMKFIRDLMGVLIDNDITPRWMTPLGLPVRMRYENYDSVMVSTRIGARARVLTIREENGKQSKRKALNGGAPNFVHSLDGFGGLLGHTMNLASFNGVQDAGSIHDTILCLAADAETMSMCVRKATVDIFQRDLLSEMRQQVLTFLPNLVELPSVPEYGSLDVTEVLSSEYYFN
jgi:DNA-directed RNA polymerase